MPSDALWKMYVGKRVTCPKGTGILVYYGPTVRSRGTKKCGVVLDQPNGSHDGKVNGARYFTCKENHGVLVAPEKVKWMEQRMSNGGKNLRKHIGGGGGPNSSQNEPQRGAKKSSRRSTTKSNSRGAEPAAAAPKSIPVLRSRNNHKSASATDDNYIGNTDETDGDDDDDSEEVESTDDVEEESQQEADSTEGELERMRRLLREKEQQIELQRLRKQMEELQAKQVVTDAATTDASTDAAEGGGDGEADACIAVLDNAVGAENADDLVTVQTGVDRAEEAAAEQAAAEQAAAEQAAAEQAAAEQAAAEQAAAEQAAAEQAAAEQAAVEQAAAEQAAAEQAAAEQAAAEQREKEEAAREEAERQALEAEQAAAMKALMEAREAEQKALQQAAAEQAAKTNAPEERSASEQIQGATSNIASEFARANHKYEPTKKGQLAMTKGEYFEIIDGSRSWWKVRNAKDEQGKVPSNYLVRVQPDEVPSQTMKEFTEKQNTAAESTSVEAPQMICRAIAAYAAKEASHLSLVKGSTYTVIDSSRNWWVVKNENGEEGRVPSNYLQKING